MEQTSWSHYAVRSLPRLKQTTMACGTGACAAVVAAVENGLCVRGADVNVHVLGGTLQVRYSDYGVTLHGSAELVFEGELEL